MISRDEILHLIPHAGAMCLLDSVQVWDEARITCLSHRYAQADNPLRRADGCLGTAAGIEIAAQAIAVHGRLTSGAKDAPRIGYLMSLRDVQLSTPMLDISLGPLLIAAERLLGDASLARYRFLVSGGGETLLSGSATLLLKAAA